MKFFNVKSYNECKATVARELKNINRKTEVVLLSNACGRISAREYRAKESVPDYARSTVDGYAVRAFTTYGATSSIPSLLNYVGKVNMGCVDELTVNPGECAYVPTGGQVPDGADSMVMVEYAEPFGEQIAIYRPASVGENVIAVGEDIKQESVLLKAGEKIDELKCGVLAALGISKVEVFKPLCVAIISTGDEIVSIGGKTQKGQIRDINTTINTEFCKKYDLEVVYTACVTDGFEQLNEAVKSGADVADVVLISGGSSIGFRDYTERVLSENGEILVHGVSLKPGKPTVVARVYGKLAFGLPGHPMACLTTLKLLFLDVYARELAGQEPIFVFANASHNFPSSPGRVTVQPVKLTYKDDDVEATPLFYKSGFVSALDGADGIILIGENEEGIASSQRVKVYLL